MSELQRRIQERDLKRKARAFYHSMQESMSLERMLWRKVKDIDQRGDEFWIDGQYQLEDGWGFRLLNEDEVLTGQAFPIDLKWIAQIAFGKSKQTKTKRKRMRRARKCKRRVRPPLMSTTTPNATYIRMPDEAATKGKLCTIQNILKAIVWFSLGVWFCSMVYILLH